MAPTTGLDEMDTVAMRGTGFTPGGTVEIWRCTPDGIDSCAGPTVFLSADSQGAVDAEGSEGALRERACGDHPPNWHGGGHRLGAA